MRQILASAAAVLALAVFSSGALADCNKNSCESKKSAPAKDAAQSAVIDPVCGMEVNPADAKYTAQYNGKTYYFCSQSCQKAFMKKPAAYTDKNKGK